MRDYFINWALLTLSALPVPLCRKSDGGARGVWAAASLCLWSAACAALYGSIASPGAVKCVFAAGVFVCALCFFGSGGWRSRLREAAVRSGVSLFPMALAGLLSGLLFAPEGLFCWQYLPLFLLFALTGLIPLRLFSSAGAPGELAFSGQRRLFPCFILTLLDLTAFLSPALAPSAVSFATLLICYAALLLTEALWSQTALTVQSLAALPEQKDRELEELRERMVQSGQRLRRQAAGERAARAVQEARLSTLESAMLRGGEWETASPPASKSLGGQRVYCAFPLLDSLMSRTEAAAAQRGMETDILLQLQTLDGLPESQLCAVFEAALTPLLRPRAGGGGLLRVRARDEEDYLCFVAGAAEPDPPLSAGDARLAAASAQSLGGWGELEELDGFQCISLLLFRESD